MLVRGKQMAGSSVKRQRFHRSLLDRHLPSSQLSPWRWTSLPDAFCSPLASAHARQRCVCEFWRRSSPSPPTSPTTLGNKHAPFGIHTKTKETAELNRKRAFRNACRPPAHPHGDEHLDLLASPECAIAPLQPQLAPLPPAHNTQASADSSERTRGMKRRRV